MSKKTELGILMGHSDKKVGETRSLSLLLYFGNEYHPRHCNIVANGRKE